jgi:hypothetical protein
MVRKVAVTVTLSLSLLTLACSSKDPGSDDGQTTTAQDGTESGESSEPSNPSTTDPGETDEDEETDEPEETEEEGGFVPPDDSLSECSVAPLSVCDELAQDCPEGEKCTPFVFGDCTFPRCLPITGSKSAGEPCTVDPMSGVDDCDANSWCYPGPLDPEQPAICISFCQGTVDDSSCPDPSHVCVANNLVFEGFIGCRPSCDPLMPAGCEAWERCTIATVDGQFGCVTAGGAANGDPCVIDQECDSGACVQADLLLECADERCCAPWCDLMAPNTCAMGLECVPIEFADPNSNVGVCALP